MIRRVSCAVLAPTRAALLQYGFLFSCDQSCAIKEIVAAKKGETLDYGNLDVQPVGIDRLATFSEPDLQARKMRIEVLLAEFQTEVNTLETQLEKAREIFQFLTTELDAVTLAIRLKNGDVVRVTCTACQGSGLKAADVTSGKFLVGGQVRSGSAFEGLSGGSASSSAPQLDPAQRCPVCQGKKYQVLERYKG